MEKRKIIPRTGTRRVLTVFLIGILWVFVLNALADAAADKARRLEGVPFQKCAACHGDVKVLPEGHPDMTQQASVDCFECHTPEKSPLRGIIPLGHTHLLHDIGCADCHGNKEPYRTVGTERCRECHGGPDEVENLTENRDENPHASPHYGNAMDCGMCHHIHARSENACLQCHDWDRITP